MKRRVWDQIKNVTAKELMAALQRDRWTLDVAGGSMHIYKKGSHRVSIHFHSGKTYGPKMLKSLLKDIGWTDDDMKRLKLVK